MRILPVTLGLLLAAGTWACGGSKGRDGGKVTPEGAEVCNTHRDKLARLYAAAIAEDDPKAKKAAEAAIPDNVEMVLIDCRTDPARFSPCIARATSVEEIERECLVPIDDAGRAEGRQFGPATASDPEQ